MRFPFFATNRQFDKEEKYCFEILDNNHRHRQLISKDLKDLEQKVLVLEGRINKLEPNKTPAWEKRYYTRREWSRMNKESRKRLFAKMDAREQKYTLKIEEAIKNGRKKGK